MCSSTFDTLATTSRTDCHTSKDGDTSGPRLLRMYEMTHFSVHDIILVDSPVFHYSIDTCDSGEVYSTCTAEYIFKLLEQEANVHS